MQLMFNNAVKAADGIFLYIYLLALKIIQFPNVIFEYDPRFCADEIMTPSRGEAYAIIVKYARFGLSDDFIELLKSLQAAGVNPIVVCNGRLRAEEREQLGEYAQRILVRNNIGRDMGAYRAATLYLHKTGLAPRRALYFNDSIFYLGGSHLDRMVRDLADSPFDVVGAFENHQHEHHIGTYAFSLSGEAFSNPKVLRILEKLPSLRHPAARHPKGRNPLVPSAQKVRLPDKRPLFL